MTSVRDEIADILLRDRERLVAGFTREDLDAAAAEWEATGLSVEEIDQWIEARALDPEAVREMVDAGITPEQGAVRTVTGHGGVQYTVAYKVSCGWLGIPEAIEAIREDAEEAELAAREDEFVARVARGWRAADFLLRRLLPVCLRGNPVLDEQADQLEALPRISSLDTLGQAMNLLDEVWEAFSAADDSACDDTIRAVLNAADGCGGLDGGNALPEEAEVADEVAKRVEALINKQSLVPVLHAYMDRPDPLT